MSGVGQQQKSGARQRASAMPLTPEVSGRVSDQGLMRHQKSARTRADDDDTAAAPKQISSATRQCA